MRGSLSMKVFNASGQLVEVFEEDNLIVAAGKQCLTLLLSAANSNKKVTKIAFGTDGADASSTDTAITSPYTKNLDGYTTPDSTSVVFQWSLGLTEANGKAIQEFGLVALDGTLFARRVRSVINKTSDLRLEGTWKIQF